MNATTNKPRVIRVYSLCTIDCEECGGHVGEWRPCDRCGTPIHARVFVIDHPELGELHVGSECFKDLMGYTYTTWHEKATETIGAIRAKLAKHSSADRRLDGAHVKKSNGRRVTLYPFSAGTAGQIESYQASSILYGRDWTMPHALSDSLVRAAIDLNLVRSISLYDPRRNDGWIVL